MSPHDRSRTRQNLAIVPAHLDATATAARRFSAVGPHHLGRLFAAHGHDVRLMSPEYVRPYVKAQKNDDRDAEGIAEAATRQPCDLSG